jgi:hypothetical protein
MFNFQLASFYLQDNFQFDIENRNRKKPKKILTKMRKNLKCTESRFFATFQVHQNTHHSEDLTVLTVIEVIRGLSSQTRSIDARGGLS